MSRNIKLRLKRQLMLKLGSAKIDDMDLMSRISDGHLSGLFFNLAVRLYSQLGKQAFKGTKRV